MLATDIWSFEVMAILAAKLSVQSVAVQSIVINNSHLFFTPHFGVQIAALVLIG
jgi:Na+-driven multidrug efflux pump